MRCTQFPFQVHGTFFANFFRPSSKKSKKKNLKFLSPQIRYGKFNLNSLEKFCPTFVASHRIEITKNEYIPILHVCNANDPNWEEVNIGGDAAAFGYRYLSRRFEIRIQSLI